MGGIPENPLDCWGGEGHGHAPERVEETDYVFADRNVYFFLFCFITFYLFNFLCIELNFRINKVIVTSFRWRHRGGSQIPDCCSSCNGEGRVRSWVIEVWWRKRKVYKVSNNYPPLIKDPPFSQPPINIKNVSPFMSFSRTSIPLLKSGSSHCQRWESNQHPFVQCA